MDATSAALAGVSLTADIKQRKAFGGNCHSPSRQVSIPIHSVKREQNDESLSPAAEMKSTATGSRSSSARKRKGVKTKEKDTEPLIEAAVMKETVVMTPLRETAPGDKPSPVREVSTIIPIT